ncbi:MAG: ribbon-helix-helix domain-containing protein [Methylococcaceae bacterium]
MITLRLDQKLETDIQAMATMMGLSKSELIRVSVAEFIQKQKKPNAWELGAELFGKYASGKGDLSVNRKALMKDKIRAKQNR